MVLNEEQAKPVERAPHCRNLLEDVDTVGVRTDHPLQSAQLPLGTAETGKQVALQSLGPRPRLGPDRPYPFARSQFPIRGQWLSCSREGGGNLLQAGSIR